MCTVTFELTDNSKKEFVKELLSSFSFIRIIDEGTNNTINSDKSDILDLAGIWKDYSIDVHELRKNAWGIDA